MSDINFRTSISKIYTHFLDHRGRISTDSRRALGEAGGVFFALSGESFDGNRFAKAALDGGATMAVVDDPNVAVDQRYVVVNDVLEALQEVATMHRSNLNIPIIGLTGSNGKTTTKELITAVLGAKYRVSATVGNLNNHIGVPLTILSFGPQTQIGVVEMGANHGGEIKRLCQIAHPTVGLITNIGRAHLEGFGSPEGVRRAKGELYDFLADSGGVALYNSGDATLLEMVGERSGMLSVGYAPQGFGINDAQTGESGYLGFTFLEQRLTTSLVGLYNIHNVAAAIAVGQMYGVESAKAMAMAAAYKPDNNRSQKIVTLHNTLILDAYNANPSSMNGALENFGAIHSPQPKVLILGDMMELGEYSAMEHTKLVEPILRCLPRAVFAVGEQMSEALGRDLAAKVEKGVEVHTFQNTVSLLKYLAINPIHQSLVLIKGSRSIGLERVAEIL